MSLAACATSGVPINALVNGYVDSQTQRPMAHFGTMTFAQVETQTQMHLQVLLPGNAFERARHAKRPCCLEQQLKHEAVFTLVTRGHFLDVGVKI